MARMFCTLKQAAARLNTTEARIETLLDEGSLREFRDGSNRLLKVADLGEMADAVCATPDRKQASQRTGGSQPAPSEQDTSSAVEIRLPWAPAAEPTTPGEAIATAHRPTSFERSAPRSGQSLHVEGEPPITVGQEDPIAAVLRPASVQRTRRQAPRVAGCTRAPRKPAAGRARRRTSVARKSIRSKRRLQTHELSLRQWLWMGLLDDEPFAIVLLLATVLLGLGSIAGAVYLLTRA